MTRSQGWTVVALGTVAAALVAYRLCQTAVVLGSEEGRWTYIYLQGYQPRFVHVFFRVALICGMMLLVPTRVIRRYEFWMVLAWLVVGFRVQGIIRQETRYSFEQIFESEGANSFYQPTLKYGAVTILRDFDRLRVELPTHARSNMPGKLLFVSVLEHVSRRPIVLSWLIVLISDLGAVLLYVFVRDLFDDQLVAYWSLILYIFVPAKLYYFPILNTITPVPILLCAWLWLRALRSRRPMYAIALGVATCGVMLFDPLALVMGLLFVAIVPLALGKAGEPWQAVLAPAGLAVAGFAGAWLGLRLTFQLDLIATFRAVAAEAASFNVVAHRPYAIWVRQNVPDFAFGMGVSQAVIGCLSCGYAVYRAFKAGFDEPITIYCLAVGAVLLLTDVAGVNRGEVIRLWIFLACFFQVPAAYLCARLESRVAVMLVVGTTLFQDILGTAMLSFVRP